MKVELLDTVWYFTADDYYKHSCCSTDGFIREGVVVGYESPDKLRIIDKKSKFYYCLNKVFHSYDDALSEIIRELNEINSKLDKQIQEFKKEFDERQKQINSLSKLGERNGTIYF